MDATFMLRGRALAVARLGYAGEVRDRQGLAARPGVHGRRAQHALRLGGGARPGGQRGPEGLAALAEGGVDYREDLLAARGRRRRVTPGERPRPWAPRPPPPAEP